MHVEICRKLSLESGFGIIIIYPSGLSSAGPAEADARLARRAPVGGAGTDELGQEGRDAQAEHEEANGVSINSRSFFWSLCNKSSTTWGLYYSADSWKLPYLWFWYLDPLGNLGCCAAYFLLFGLLGSYYITT